MSVWRIILACNDGEPESCSTQYGTNGLSLKRTRYQAAADGWTVDVGGKDYCQNHMPPKERT